MFEPYHLIDRCVLNREVFLDSFVDSLAAQAGALKVGDGFADGVQIGPLANDRRLAAMTRT